MKPTLVSPFHELLASPATLIQPKKTYGQTDPSNPGLEEQIAGLKGGGRPLSKSERDFFEPRFGYDFSKVRVRTDTKAAESAQVLNAQALTIGNTIVLSSSNNTTNTISGRRLMAHEMTHVLQQGEALKAPKIKYQFNQGIRHRILCKEAEEEETEYIKGAPSGFLNLWKYVPLPKGAAPVPKMNVRHILGRMKFGWTSSYGNSYLLKSISPKTLYRYYREAVFSGVKDGFVKLSNGQIWRIRVNDGKFFPVKSGGILTLVSNEVKLLKSFVKQTRAIGAAKALSNLSKGMTTQGYQISSHMEIALNVIGRKLGITEKAMAQALSNQIRALKNPPDDLIKASRNKSLGRAFKIIKWGGRVLLLVTVGADVYEVYEAKWSPKMITKKIGAWAASLMLGGLAAEKSAPLLAGGPKGWIGYGVIVAGAGILGYLGGGKTTETIYEWVFE